MTKERNPDLKVAGIAEAEHTNIKGLPPLEGGRMYFTEIGYSQSYPWVEIRRTAKTVTLAKVNVKRDPDWKPNIHPGGFVGHCDNQGSQTWLFDGINPDHTRTVRRVKSRYAGEDEMWGLRGVKYVEGRAVEFYDYNF